jgi:hypothetical protein
MQLQCAEVIYEDIGNDTGNSDAASEIKEHI